MHIWNIWYLEVFIYYHSFMYIVCTKWKKKLINLMGINALIKERIMILGYLCDCRLPKREKHTRGSSIDVTMRVSWMRKKMTITTTFTTASTSMKDSINRCARTMIWGSKTVTSKKRNLCPYRRRFRMSLGFH